MYSALINGEVHCIKPKKSTSECFMRNCCTAPIEVDVSCTFSVELQCTLAPSKKYGTQNDLFLHFNSYISKEISVTARHSVL